MLPTLNGRIQTRLIALGLLGAVVALLITPFLVEPGATLGTTYRITFTVLIATVLVGVGWELLYHFLQQFRWEKDWPTLFGLVTVINEGLLIWALLNHTTLILPEALRPPTSSFLIQFVVTWLVFWLTVNGPIRIVFHRWRFIGGRFL